jgi:hypothetical protein
MNTQAFTLSSKRLLHEIITLVSMRQSMALCKTYNLPCQTMNVKALWDTGASGSCISGGLAKRLGLKPVDMCSVNGVNGTHKSAVYLLDILLPSDVSIVQVRVSEFVDNGAFEIIIGMDIITLGDFAISNKDNTTTVSFRTPPDNTPIDFVKQLSSS